MPVAVAVPRPCHPAPWPPSLGLRGPGGRKDSPVRLCVECSVLEAGSAKNMLVGEGVRVYVCILQTATKTERVNIEIKETLL